MPFIPHTAAEIHEMLATLGIDSIEALFDEIPEELRISGLQEIPESLSEMEVTRIMQQRAAQDGNPLNFLGAGAYEHHIPAAVWQIATRGEFYSAYTPYQAEASQGTLQLIYEYQTMMSSLTAMDVSNASLYDGATALAEAVLMAVRANRHSKSRRILLPQSVHPAYRAAVRSIVRFQGIELIPLPFDLRAGRVSIDHLNAFMGEDIAALIIPQPNFFGILEEVDELTTWGQQNRVLVIGVVNPLTLALLNPPGEWGEQGADIVCGEAQPLGAPLSSGGPYAGFMCCKQRYVRQLPGRIVGRTVDADGKLGFVLTLQAREQHIRRSKATSNICTNQGLVVTAVTIHMALLGAAGLERVAANCYAKAHQLATQLTDIEGVEPVFNGDFFHEFTVHVNRSIPPVLEHMAEKNIIGGYRLEQDYPELENTLLICATETKTDEDLQHYTTSLSEALQ